MNIVQSSQLVEKARGFLFLESNSTPQAVNGEPGT